MNRMRWHPILAIVLRQFYLMRGSPARLMRVLEWITARQSLRAVLVNIFAGITDLAEFATLLATAIDQSPNLRVPVVALLVPGPRESVPAGRVVARVRAIVRVARVSVVALLAALDSAVAAHRLEHAGRAAAVVVRGVAVVAALAALHDPVAALLAQLPGGRAGIACLDGLAVGGAAVVGGVETQQWLNRLLGIADVLHLKALAFPHN